MENETAPGVKVQVRVASPFRGKCPVRTLGDGGAELGQVPSPDPSPSQSRQSRASSPEGGAKNTPHITKGEPK